MAVCFSPTESSRSCSRLRPLRWPPRDMP